MSDKYYQQAEYLIVKGYLPGANVEKVAARLRESKANTSISSFINSSESVYQDIVEDIQKIKLNTDPNKAELVTDIERQSAIANGNLKTG